MQLPQSPLQPKLILASGSPRRKWLLDQAGLTFGIIPNAIDETHDGASAPADHARLLAEKKAAAIARKHPGSYVIGADTIVVIDGIILGKPTSAKDARSMLKMLNGQTHEVITGFAVRCAEDGWFHSASVRTYVWFKSLTTSEIEWYLDTKEPFDKAGGYAIQGRGAFMVKRIEGSYTNVVGLPMSELIDCLIHVGLAGHLRK